MGDREGGRAELVNGKQRIYFVSLSFKHSGCSDPTRASLLLVIAGAVEWIFQPSRLASKSEEEEKIILKVALAEFQCVQTGHQKSVLNFASRAVH